MFEKCFYHVSEKGELCQVAALADAQAAARGGLIWLDYRQPAAADLAALIEPLGIHPLSIEDCTDTNQVPKIDDFPSNSFVIVNSFRVAEGKLIVDEVDLFLGHNYLVTVSSQDPAASSALSGWTQMVRSRDRRFSCT